MARTKAQQDAIDAMNAADEERKRAQAIRDSASTADGRKQGDQMIRDSEANKRKAVKAAQDAT